jgi:hypothetical protein
LEAKIIDNKVEAFVKVLPIRLVDAIQGLSQIDDWASSTIGVKPLAIREAH